ncbi:glycosyltransferase family 2 protein [Nonomuraea roseoviolacea]|uniref:GT2 family glycosyltransferase n=1 Tax=Nonomuraea roseoviolacea subsp. carminata TaxID=160689 RepID=A0ABT1KA72_9ACTN|nr:glycosyltransferase [Nonomuraea roseoviolacea]MCP2350915.1 GT2 family glycosyltransferase [Nonomuraea roseoviolacea subsp. carminata]
MITVVVPTVGRPSLRATLAALGPDVPVIVVDDRPAGHDGPPLVTSAHVPVNVRVVTSGGRGPAAARNAGWRAAATPWIAFLDDDVVPAPGWYEALLKDLAELPPEAAGSQGRIEVPLPDGRRPTDAERNTAGLAGALWITADIAYRRAALERVGGFDERFPRAYREDADLALRLTNRGHTLAWGERVTVHPVRDDGFWASVRFQRGNADDALMRRLHGPGWREAIGGARGRLRRHAATTALGLAAAGLGLAALLTRRRAEQRRAAFRLTPLRADGRRAASPLTARRSLAWPAVVAGAGWAAMTAEFAWARIAPGPRTPGEVLRMAVTSVLIPPVAVAHRLRGEWKVRR